MKPTPVLLILLLVFAGFRCTEISSVEEARIVVYVHWGETPLQRKVEILETGDSLETNEKGIAEFKIKPGTYTIRAHNINRGGPCCAYVDEIVTVKSSERRKLDVIDCLPCV